MKLVKTTVLATTLFGSSALFAADETIEKLTQNLNALMPGITSEHIQKAPIEGLYEVSYGANVFYFNADGSLMVQGDIIDVEKRVNLTEERRADGRQSVMDKIDESEMIVYPAKDEKHVVTVFTDIDCPYCRKLHRDIPDYNAKGITVRYLAFPRAGVGSPSYNKAVSVWCSDDRATALTQAKEGNTPENKTCDNPVMKHMKVGQTIGVRGTPAIVMSSGDMLPGYVPADQLLQALEQTK